MKKKTVALLLALVLVFGVVAGGTLAWLTASTKEVKNTFTYGDINIDLYEHEYDADTNTLTKNEVRDAETNDNYIIIPGVNLPKDPKVTVTVGSEKCWLFVKVVETGTFVEGKVTYTLNFDNTWKHGDDTDIPANVYYKEVDASAADFSLELLVGNQIVVRDTLTKDDLAKIAKDENVPTLSFQAYAVQYTKFETDPAGAWKAITG